MKSQVVLSIAIFFSFLLLISARERTSPTCGRRLPSFNPLIVGGFPSIGHWPWHAGIHYIGHPRKASTKSGEQQQNNAPEYACGGTLIDTNTVLTSAHCVCKYNQPLNAENVLVSLGKRNLSELTRSSDFLNANSIIQHPNYNSIDLSNDIAIIKISSYVSFDNYVQPICLWPASKLSLSEVIGRVGTVVGWGRANSNGLSDVLQQAKMPVVDSLTCLVSNRNFFGSFISDKNFCAGFRNGTSVCNGDSGGSLVFEDNGVYYIRGIVSLSKAIGRQSEESPIICDPNEYVLFTDVAQYLPWIAQVQATSCEKRVHYRLYLVDVIGLSCKVDINITLAERDCKIILEATTTENFYNLFDGFVSLLILQGNIEALPDLTEAFDTFKNITSLAVAFAQLESIERNKLYVARRITTASFTHNRIAEISPSTFDDMSEMQHLDLNFNLLTAIHRDVFRELHKLKELHFAWNRIETLPEGLFRNNPELEIINFEHNRLKIVATDFRDLAKLRSLKLSKNDRIDECYGTSLYVTCNAISIINLQSIILRQCS